jgi:hypothetical protein
MFKNIYYHLLTKTAYFVGDVVCELDYEWAAKLYQKSMLFSYECDEKIGFKIWQVPPLNREEDL